MQLSLNRLVHEMRLQWYSLRPLLLWLQSVQGKYDCVVVASNRNFRDFSPEPLVCDSQTRDSDMCLRVALGEAPKLMFSGEFLFE